MKIAIFKDLDPMEGDRGLEIKFFKSEGEKDFDLKLWRLQKKSSAEFLGWVLFGIANGQSIYAKRE